MKSKGAIRFFAIALAVVCAFQLSFTVVTQMVRQDAGEISGDNRMQQQRYLDSMSTEVVYDLGIQEYTYAECSERELNLGLDLQGGMHTTLAVSIPDLIRQLAGNNQDETFKKALQQAQERQKQSQERFIDLFYAAYREIDPDGKLAPIFATRQNQDAISFTSSNEEVLRFLRRETSEALDRTYNILRARVDKFGVAQPNIQQQEGTGRIIVELPGVEDPERVRRLLQGTAKLEFFETYENQEILEYLGEANQVLADLKALENEDSTATDADSSLQIESLPESTAASENVPDTAVEDPLEEAVAGDADTGLADTAQDLLAGLDEDTADADTSLTQAQARRQNPLFSVLIPNLRQQGDQQVIVPGPVVGFTRGADTAQVREMLQKKEVQQVLPNDARFYWTAKTVSEESNFYQLVAIRVNTRDGEAPLDGSVITNARQDFGQMSGRPEIVMNMSPTGAQKWRRMTADNVGRSVAVVLDNRVYSFPTVQGEIPNGRTQITGDFTITEAKDLATILEAGRLPTQVRIIEEAIVGPSLGEESIQAGLVSLVVGLVLVLVFMAFYYRTAGWVADLALMVNLFYIIGVLASLGAALTLPGMAGIVLTIGMSVDANVLIFERIREELLGDKNTKAAIKDGYDRAYSSILDANITTLLVGIILYTFGTGPIKGFATVLIIGILTSLFSAIFITRLLFEARLGKEKGVAFGSQSTLQALRSFSYNFLGGRKTAYLVSGIIILAGIGSMVVRGLEYGVDFKGGYSYVVRFDQPVQTTRVRDALAEPLEAAPQVKTFGEANQVKIVTDYLIDSQDEKANDRVEAQLMNGLQTLDYGQVKIMSSQKVGPTIADDIKQSAVFSVVFSLLIIFFYIFVRFRKWQYGLGATLTLLHDVLVVFSIFSLLQGLLPFSLEVDQAFIAAILTVVGYSINDTVVVFDRIRERLQLRKRSGFIETVNVALNDTLSRTLITSLTTLLVVLVLFIFGGEIIRGFSFALLIGVAVGTYSSVFIATPIVVDLEKEKEPANA